MLFNKKFTIAAEAHVDKRIMVKTLKYFIFFLCTASIATGVFANDLILAENGKTDYQIVSDFSTPKKIWNAKFLAWILKEATGAEFPIRGDRVMNPKKPAIFVGVSQPVRKRIGMVYQGMKDQDHVVRSKGKDIFLYGKGYDADFYAIMEFLDKFFGIRWYQRMTNPQIEKHNKVVLKPFNHKYSWAFTYRQLPAPQLSDYFRGLTSIRDNVAGWRRYLKPQLGKEDFKHGFVPGSAVCPEQPEIDPAHTVYKYIPTAGNVKGVKGYPFIKNRDYFKTNPEFYTMQNGRRRKGQLCFSNPALRKEFTKNIEHHLDYLGTDDVIIQISYDDGYPGIPCNCPACKALSKKYGTPGAALFDYVMELGKEFQKKHPRTTIKVPLYRKSQTELAPDYPRGTKFPENVLFFFAPIDDYINYTWDSPHNAPTFENLKKWAELSDRIYIHNYMGFAIANHMPCSNIGVLVDTIRKLHAFGIKGFFYEYYPANSGFLWNFTNFSDLALCVFYKMMKDPGIDIDLFIDDYMKKVYGPAHKLTRTYYDELESASSTNNKYGFGGTDGDLMRKRHFYDYLSPERLLRWSKLFDKMEKLTAGNKNHEKNIANLRRALDCAVYHKWPELAKFDPKYFNDAAKVRARIGNIPRNPHSVLLKEMLAKAEKKIRYAGKEKPLPSRFNGIPPECIIQEIPQNNRSVYDTKISRIVDDKDAAFGYAASIDRPDLPFNCGFYQKDTRKRGPSLKIDACDISPGKYRLYELGNICLSKNCIIWFSNKSWVTNLQLGYHFDSKNPDTKYQVFISLKFPEKYKGQKTDLVLCDRIILVKKK